MPSWTSRTFTSHKIYCPILSHGITLFTAHSSFNPKCWRQTPHAQREAEPRLLGRYESNRTFLHIDQFYSMENAIRNIYHIDMEGFLKHIHTANMYAGTVRLKWPDSHMFSHHHYQCEMIMFCFGTFDGWLIWFNAMLVPLIALTRVGLPLLKSLTCWFHPLPHSHQFATYLSCRLTCSYLWRLPHYQLWHCCWCTSATCLSCRSGRLLRYLWQWTSTTGSHKPPSCTMASSPQQWAFSLS